VVLNFRVWDLNSVLAPHPGRRFEFLIYSGVILSGFRFILVGLWENS
jgi:hypothetical protein